jgi:hypothetical protein
MPPSFTASACFASVAYRRAESEYPVLSVFVRGVKSVCLEESRHSQCQNMSEEGMTIELIHGEIIGQIIGASFDV